MYEVNIFILLPDAKMLSRVYAHCRVDSWSEHLANIIVLYSFSGRQCDMWDEVVGKDEAHQTNYLYCVLTMKKFSLTAKFFSPLKYFIIDWIKCFLFYRSFVLRTFSEDVTRT